MTTSLHVSANGRYLQDAAGRPFFYLGDTAWELFHRLDREEASHYLQDRSRKGYSVIQAVVLAEIDGLTVPNPYGQLPLDNMDPAQPNEGYFQHVDFIVDEAAKMGLYIGMLPTWGSHWQGSQEQPAIFDVANAQQYGEFLGERYKDKPIIWILGGDRNIRSDKERRIMDALAAGLAIGDQGRHLISYHPMGPGRSSENCAEASWLDFHMFQSSHGAHDHDNGLFAAADYQLEPVKPTLDGEPRYETIPVGFYVKQNDWRDRFDDFDVRQAAYWSLLAGACGHTYGNNNVWQMWTSERTPRIGANTPWQEALQHPGAWQMKYVKRLFTARPFHKLVPDEQLVVSGPTTGGAKIRAAVAHDNSFALVYSPYGESFTVNKSLMQQERLREIWYDPRYGVSYPRMASPTKGFQTYTPPTSGRGRDWILILEDAAAELPLPECSE